MVVAMVEVVDYCESVSPIDRAWWGLKHARDVGLCRPKHWVAKQPLYDICIWPPSSGYFTGFSLLFSYCTSFVLVL